MAFIKKITSKEEYEKFLDDNEKVILKFSAEWCGPCRVLENTISKLDSENLNGFVLCEVNVDDDFADDLTFSFGVRNIPVTLFIVKKEVKQKLVGIITESQFYEEVKKY
jgi:thioredoxin 1